MSRECHGRVQEVSRLQQEEEDHEAEGEPGEHRAQPAEKHDHKLGDHDRHAEVALAEEGDLAADGAPVH